MNSQLHCVGKEEQFFNVKVGGKYSNHCASYGLLLCALSRCVATVRVPYTYRGLQQARGKQTLSFLEHN
jgi:hypothetical protein